jgi:hypothetical protein
MKSLKKIINQCLDNFIEQNTIEIACFEKSATFYLYYNSYPPIGGIINLDKNKKKFKIESLEIQGEHGKFCIANGIFID